MLKKSLDHSRTIDKYICNNLHVVVSLVKLFNANFLTSSLCGVEDSTSACFTTAYTGKKIRNQIKKQADMLLPVSPKMGLGNICSMLNVYDVVPRVRRTNTAN